MALFRGILASSQLSKIASRTSVRFFADKADKDGKVLTFAEDVEHATGDEKKLLILAERGITDPYYLNALKRGPGTKDQPNLVPAFEEKRMIGCVCEEDATAINWMWVHKGDPRRCECGHWFKCVDAVDHFAKIDEELAQQGKHTW